MNKLMEEEEATEQIMEDIDETEETLSLFDYSINTAAAESEWDQDYCSTELQRSTSIFDHEEQYFEFCSEEWSSTTIANSHETIIFCGKIIPYQEPTRGNTQNSQSIKEKRQKKPRIFQWKSKRKDSSNTRKEESKSLAMPESRKFSVHNITILASPGKFRWYLLFGITRFPKEMALRDMKNRQSRRSPSPLFRLEGGEKKKKVNSSTDQCKNRGQGLRGLLKALGYDGHHHANTVVKASIGCIP